MNDGRVHCLECVGTSDGEPDPATMGLCVFHRRKVEAALRTTRETLADPDRLEQIAHWLDLYDEWGEAVVRMNQRLGVNIPAETSEGVLRIISGTELQDDLRRWAERARRVLDTPQAPDTNEQTETPC